MKIEDILLEQAVKKNKALVATTKSYDFVKKNDTLAISLQGPHTVEELENIISILKDVLRKTDYDNFPAESTT